MIASVHIPHRQDNPSLTATFIGTLTDPNDWIGEGALSSSSAFLSKLSTETSSASLGGFLTLCYRLVVRSADVKIVSALGATILAIHITLSSINLMLHIQLSIVIKLLGSFPARTVDGLIRIH